MRCAVAAGIRSCCLALTCGVVGRDRVVRFSTLSQRLAAWPMVDEYLFTASLKLTYGSAALLASSIRTRLSTRKCTSVGCGNVTREHTYT